MMMVLTSSSIIGSPNPWDHIDDANLSYRVVKHNSLIDAFELLTSCYLSDYDVRE